jgi:hypothetical protein
MRVYTVLLKDSSNVWHLQMVPALQRLGHDIYLPRLGLDESWARMNAGRWSYRHRARQTLRLLEDIRKVHAAKPIGLFFALVYAFQFEPWVFKAIRAMDIPTVWFFCDNLQYPREAEKLAPYFDLTWVPERKAISMYQRLHCEYIYLPMAADPDLNRPTVPEGGKEVVFIGTKNPYRRWLLGMALAKGLPVEIYGTGWHPTSTHHLSGDSVASQSCEPLSRVEMAVNFLEEKKESIIQILRYGLRPRFSRGPIQHRGEAFEELVTRNSSAKPLDFKQVQELYGQAKVTLGENHYIDPGCTDLDHCTYSKARDFEAPMSGACYLTRYTEELDQLYPEKDMLMTYRTADELCENAQRLLKDKDLRARLRRNARKFCLEHHTWRHRFEKLFDRLGLG